VPWSKQDLFPIPPIGYNKSACYFNIVISLCDCYEIQFIKIQDVEYLYKFMPEDELMFYTNLFQRYKETFK